MTADIFPSSYLVDGGFLSPDFDSAFCDSEHKFCVDVLINIYLLYQMLIQYRLVKYVQYFHINSMCLLSIYFYVQNLIEIIPLSLSLPSLRSCFVSWGFCVLMSFFLSFSFQNHCADDFSLFMLPILSPWVIDYFPFDVGSPVYFPRCHILICPYWRLIGTPYIY